MIDEVIEFFVVVACEIEVLWSHLSPKRSIKQSFLVFFEIKIGIESSISDISIEFSAHILRHETIDDTSVFYHIGEMYNNRRSHKADG